MNRPSRGLLGLRLSKGRTAGYLPGGLNGNYLTSAKAISQQPSI